MSVEPNLNQYVALKTVVSYFMDQHVKSEGDQDMYWIIGMRGLTDLNYDIAAQPKTVRLPVLANKTVPFPADLLSWSKIGLLNSEGEVVTLKINTGLTTFRDNNPNRLEDLTANVNSSVGTLAYSAYYLNYYYNNGYYNLFGVGGGLIQYGECRVDDKNRVIVLPPDFNYQNIIVEYISAPERDEDFTVPLALQEALIAFIEWKTKLGPREEYYAQKVNARRRMPKKKVTLQSINQVLREPNAFKLRS
jgi:hypothetical protein